MRVTDWTLLQYRQAIYVPEGMLLLYVTVAYNDNVNDILVKFIYRETARILPHFHSHKDNISATFPLLTFFIHCQHHHWKEWMTVLTRACCYIHNSQKLCSVHWIKRQEYSLTLCVLVVNSKWFDRYICKFWSMFYLVSCIMRKCFLPTHFKMYFSSLQWKSTGFKFLSGNAVLCLCWVKVSAS
jgi:hypothetical protein